VSVYIQTRLKNHSKVQTNQPTNTVGLEFRQSNTHTHTHKYTESNIVQRAFPPLSFWLLHVMICKGADHIIYIHRLQTRLLSSATPKEQIKRPFLSWKLALSFFMCQTLLLAELNHSVVILEPPNGTFAHKLNHSFFSFVDENLEIIFWSPRISWLWLCESLWRSTAQSCHLHWHVWIHDEVPNFTEPKP